jgi:3-deoxy-D-manno-octulosonate 8-phosphate phosphatase (KDO 8-P phosphatase)
MPLPQDSIDARARQLRLLLFDVDGVLTDGSVFINADGSEQKRFFIRDGAAIVWAQRAGLLVGLLSGRASDATTRRAAELSIPIVLQGQPDKRIAYGRLLAERGLRDEHVAYMGDDLMDLPVLTRAGLSAAPADAIGDVLTRVHWVSRYDGGRGAAREMIEMVLMALGRWDSLTGSFLA